MSRPRRQTRQGATAAAFSGLVGFVLIAALAGVLGVVLLAGLIGLVAVVLWDVATAAGRPQRFPLTRRLLHLLGARFRCLRPEPLRFETLDELLALSPKEFEETIARSLREHGYRHVRCVGGPGDLGADITCRDPNGRTVALQCKRYSPNVSVGSREIQLFIGMTTTHHRVDRAVFVTTSTFTAPAKALAQTQGIRLITAIDLIRIFGMREPRPIAGQTTTIPM